MIVVLGFVLGMGLKTATNYLRSSLIKETNYRMDQIDDAISTYLKTHERLPCPAGRTAAETSAGFGFPPVICSNDTEIDTLDTSDTVTGLRTGVVPVRELGLPASYMFDAYGNRFTYAVVKDLAVDKATYDAYGAANAVTDGVILINSKAGHQSTNPSVKTIIPYVLISHGKDGKGAWTRAGAPKGGCSGSNPDVENCDNDAVFIDSQLNDGDVAAQYYDDIVRWISKDRLELKAGKLTINIGDTLPSCTAGQSIYHNGTTFACSPTCTSNQSLLFNGTSWVCEDKYLGVNVGSVATAASSAANGTFYNDYAISAYPGAKYVAIQGVCSSYGNANARTEAAYFFLNGSGVSIGSGVICDSRVNITEGRWAVAQNTVPVPLNAATLRLRRVAESLHGATTIQIHANFYR